MQNPQAPSTTKVVCDLPARGTTEGSNWYNMAMYVDNQKISNSHYFWVKFDDWKSPMVTDILTPRYTKVGEKVSFYGRIFSDLYGNSKNPGDEEDALIDDNTASILGVFSGEQECELTDYLGEKYGVHLSGVNDCGLDDSCGNITCKLKGTFIGPTLIEYYVSTYGASQNDLDKFNVDSLGQLYHIHTLPTVDVVSKSSGSNNGGQLITVSGTGFDAFPGKTNVYLGSQKCNIETIESSQLTCRTPPKPSELDTADYENIYAGGAGLEYKIWMNTGDISTNDGLSNVITSLGVEDNSTFIDGIAYISEPVFNETENDTYTSILAGFFVCTFTSDYVVILKSSGHSTAYINLNQTAMDPVATCCLLYTSDAADE